MNKAGYLITSTITPKTYFTSASAYDRPSWVGINEATKYVTADIAELALKKLIKHGVYQCRLMSIQEAMDFEFPNEKPQEEVSSVSAPIDDEDGDEMVAHDQEEVCAGCDHVPCTCQVDDVEMDPSERDGRDPELDNIRGIEDEEATGAGNRFVPGQTVSYKGGEFVVVRDSRGGVTPIAPLDNPNQVRRVGNTDLRLVREAVATRVDESIKRPSAHEKEIAAKSKKYYDDLATKRDKAGETYHVGNAKVTQAPLEGWCLVMANGRVTGHIHSDKADAETEQKSCPAAVRIRFGKRASDGSNEYVATRAFDESIDESIDDTVARITYSNDARTNDPVDFGGDCDDVKVKVPSDVKAELARVIAEFTKTAEEQNGRDDARSSFAMTCASAMQELADLIDQGTIAGIKQAQIKLTTLMNPITSNIPSVVLKFIHMGGRKPSLKDLFDDKRESKKIMSEATQDDHDNMAKAYDDDMKRDSLQPKFAVVIKHDGGTKTEYIKADNKEAAREKATKHCLKGLKNVKVTNVTEIR